MSLVIAHNINKRVFLWSIKMVDVAFVGQLVDSMETAVLKVESAIVANNIDEANKLR